MSILGKLLVTLLPLLFFGVSALTLNAGSIDTYAGGGPDNLPALSANLGLPTGVALDGSGSIYIVDNRNHRIFKVDGTGRMSVVAGNGTSGFSGDGGLAAEASLSNPTGLAADEAGNLYIADQGNQRIRKVDIAGIITTVAGNGTAGFSGDGGPGVVASLFNPTGLATDRAGNLYIADQGNQRIRKMNTSGIITTVAGNGTAGFSGDGGPAVVASLSFPTGVAADRAGNLQIADQGNHRIRKVNSAGIITTAAGNGTAGFFGDGGPAVVAGLSFPAGVATDEAGSFYIADQNNLRIRQVDPAGVITTVAGNGTAGFSGDGEPATVASLFHPTGVAVDRSGNLYIADRDNHRIRKVDPAGVITTLAGSGTAGFSGDGGPATAAELANPTGIAVIGFANPSIYIADFSNHRVRKVDSAGFITTVAGNGLAGFSGDGGPATAASLADPFAVAVDVSGNLFIADRDNQRIRKVDIDGVITTVAGNGMAGFSGDGGSATAASLYFPFGVAVDDAGNLYIADRNNQRIRRVDPAGVITTVAGNGTAGFSGDGGPAFIAALSFPSGVAVDNAGNLYIADQNNQRIRRVDPAGVITTVAGNGSFGFFGDGGPATAASLAFPIGMVVDGADNLYIADHLNQRIRLVVEVNRAPVPD
jgi:sugar lactone lactonase YvrE